jgi:hypothetical protein
MSKQEIYNVLFKMSELYSTKINKFSLQHLSEKLDGKNPDLIKQALDKHNESNKYFPTYSDIIELIGDLRRGEKTIKKECQRCKGSGSVVFFNKNTYESSAFSCRCENGKAWERTLLNSEGKINIQCEEYAKSEWVPRNVFVDPRPKMSEEQRAERINSYWDAIYANAK